MQNLKKCMGELNQKKNVRKREQHIIVMGDMNCKIGDLINKEEISKGGEDYDKNYQRKQSDHPK